MNAMPRLKIEKSATSGMKRNHDQSGREPKMIARMNISARVGMKFMRFCRTFATGSTILGKGRDCTRLVLEMIAFAPPFIEELKNSSENTPMTRNDTKLSGLLFPVMMKPNTVP